MNPIQFIDRATGKRVMETVMGDKALAFAYETLLGRTLWPVLFGSRLVSAVLGHYYDSPRSRAAISALARLPGCAPEEAELPLDAYASFNAFFTRRLKPGARPLGDGVTSPADGRLTIYPDASLDLPFPLKGARRTLRDVLAEPDAAAERLDIVVVRLAPVDYHRFHFPFACTVAEAPRIIPGQYHSVNPIALIRHPDVYADNERQVTRCRTPFGTCYMIEVGAFGVGTIRQIFSPGPQAKGGEKGYFKFGGSTVILAAPAGKIVFDADLLDNSRKGLETRVMARERIGACE